MKTSKAKLKRAGFTIVELLTVMGIIALLLGLLVPALNLVRDYSKEIQQGAQFHSIGVGLAMFKTEFGSYPESSDNFVTPHPVDDTPYGGAQKLAEAMVGLDFLGFHPKADFRADGTYSRDDGQGGIEDPRVYDAIGGIEENGATPGMFGETGLENMQARKGPFVTLENANAFKMEDVYENYEDFAFDSLVLCDEYSKKRHSVHKTGKPVLYYRARTGYTQQKSSDGIADDIYYYPDNALLIDLTTVDDDGTAARLDSELEFDEMILNEKFTGIDTVQKPYRENSYILISAGKDGLYGTPDDTFNFKKG